jgi:hypothetical protein
MHAFRRVNYLFVHACMHGQPLFWVRNGLRELKNAGFMEEAEGKYGLSKNGKTLV